MMGPNKNSKVKIHIDGSYAFIIFIYLLELGIRLSWKNLFRFLLHFLSEKSGDSQLFIDKSISSVFMGDPARADERREKFRHELLMAGIDSKLRPLKMVDNCRSDGCRGYKEDGIDALNIAHMFYDAFVGTAANAIPTVQYSYLVLFAGDSDFASTFDLLHALGIKIVVVYFDVNKVHRPTSELIIKSADYAISLESLLYDRGNVLAQSIFEPVSGLKLPPPTEITKKQVLTPPTAVLNTGVGNVKFFDSTNGWGVISSFDGDYYCHVSDVKSGHSLVNGCKVRFNIQKRPLPNDGRMSRSVTNGKATDIVVISSESSSALKPVEKDEKVAPVKSLLPQVSEGELKKLVAGCATRENGFALLAEVGAAYKFKFGKPERPLKEILADYPATFEFCNSPAASVRIIA